MKSLAIRWDEKTVEYCKMLCGANTGLLVAGGYLAGLSCPFYIGVLAASLNYGAALNKLDIEDSASCHQFFKRSCWYGVYIFLSILIGKAFVHKKKEIPKEEQKAAEPRD